jgi:hypothetical protein
MSGEVAGEGAVRRAVCATIPLPSRWGAAPCPHCRGHRKGDRAQRRPWAGRQVPSASSTSPPRGYTRPSPAPSRSSPRPARSTGAAPGPRSVSVPRPGSRQRGDSSPGLPRAGVGIVRRDGLPVRALGRESRDARNPSCRKVRASSGIPRHRLNGEGGIRPAPSPQPIPQTGLATEVTESQGVRFSRSVPDDTGHYGSFGILFSTFPAQPDKATDSSRTARPTRLLTAASVPIRLLFRRGGLR